MSTESRTEQLLNAYINGDDISNFVPLSRNEQILKDMILGNEQTSSPQSRIESLYAKLDEKIKNSSTEITLKMLLDETKSAQHMFAEYEGSSDDINRLIKYNDTMNVTDMHHMFFRCKFDSAPDLNTSNVTNMNDMFLDVFNLKTIPKYDTSKVIYMNSFLGTQGGEDRNFTTFPNLDISNVKETSSMFRHRSKLVDLPPLNTNNVTSMQSMFYCCSSLEKIDITRFISSNSEVCCNCYSLKQLIIRNMDIIFSLESSTFKNCYHFYGTIDRTYNPEGLKDGRIYVPDDKIEKLKNLTNWSLFSDILRPLSILENNISYISDCEYLINDEIKKEIFLRDFINEPNIDIISNNEDVVTISNININTEKIDFKINPKNIGTSIITYNIIGDTNKSSSFKINIVDHMVERIVPGSLYFDDFEKNNDDFYINKEDLNSDCALCKISFYISENSSKSLTLDCINYSNYPQNMYGVLSNIDTNLSIYSYDSSEKIYKSFEGTKYHSEESIRITYNDIPVGKHFIIVKFIKRYAGYYYKGQYFKFKIFL